MLSNTLLIGSLSNISWLKKQGFKGAITIECELNGTRHDYVIQTRKYLQELLDR